MESITLNLTLPKSWAELTPPQLRYAYFLISQNYSATEVKTYALIRWLPLIVLERTDTGMWCRYGGQSYFFTAQQITEVLSFLDWLERIPPFPVRIPSIGKHQAVEPDLSGLSFENYLVLENLYQGFLCTKNESLLEEMAAILYTSSAPLKLLPEESTSIFYWFAALKQYLASKYPHFFSPTGEQASTEGMQHRLEEAMNNQIRALTKGDVTKEAQVLASEVHRALAELDAQARDYEELKKKSL